MINSITCNGGLGHLHRPQRTTSGDQAALSEVCFDEIERVFGQGLWNNHL